MTDRDLLTSSAAASYLGLTPRALRRLIAEGILPTVNTPGGTAIHRRVLDAFLEAHRVRPGQLRHLYERSPVTR